MPWHPPRGLKLGAAAVLLTVPLLAGEAAFCIRGTVVNAVTGEPIRRAAVTASQSAFLTDAAGVFSFCGLRAGSYYASGEKPGFAAAGLLVSVGPSREDIQLRLQPLAVVKGKALDSNGEPLENALVQLLSVKVQSGRRRVRVASVAATDDRGEYRLSGLRPGRYLLRAAGWQGSSASDEAGSYATFAPVYYGGARELAFAMPLMVEADHETIADFSLGLETAYRIRGNLSGYSPLVPLSIELLRPGEGVSAGRVDFDAATGAFAISPVAPGSYILRATQGEGSRRVAGEQAVEIGASNVDGMVLTLAGSVALKGMVRVENVSETAPSSPGCSVALSPADAWVSDPDTLESPTGEVGAFAIAGVLPGRYLLRMDCANGYIKTARADEMDLLTRDELVIPGGSPPLLDAVLGMDGAMLDVSATQNDAPAAGWLLLLPASGANIHAKLSVLRGKATLTGVAPGDYQAYAWTGSADEFEYANPNVRQAWAARAVSVHVAAGERQTIALQAYAGEIP
jgi:hypothetical protein